MTRLAVPDPLAQGEDTGEDWFIEHVMGELDAPNEFFYDAAAGKLYFYYNASTSEWPTAHRPVQQDVWKLTVSCAWWLCRCAPAAHDYLLHGRQPRHL